MKELKAKMFNRKASNPKNKPDEIIKNLKIKSGLKIIDLGSGGGYYSFKFADLVGKKGKVYSIDTDKDLLKFISNKTKKQINIKTILTTENKIPILDEKVDLIFIRNVYHHLKDRIKYIIQFKNILNPNGKIAIIEYKKRGGYFNLHRPSNHYVIPEIIIKEMETAGFQIKEQYFFLPEQSYIIFSCKN